MFFARVWFTGVITRRASSRNYTCAPGVWTESARRIFLLLPSRYCSAAAIINKRPKLYNSYYKEIFKANFNNEWLYADRFFADRWGVYMRASTA